MGNPINYTDPSGKRVDPGCYTTECLYGWAQQNYDSERAYNLACQQGVVEDCSAAVQALGQIPGVPTVSALLGLIYNPDKKQARIVLEGDVPSPIDPPPGCTFHPRCPRAVKGTCDTEGPPLEELAGSNGHKVACWNPHVDT